VRYVTARLSKATTKGTNPRSTLLWRRGRVSVASSNQASLISGAVSWSLNERVLKGLSCLWSSTTFANGIIQRRFTKSGSHSRRATKLEASLLEEVWRTSNLSCRGLEVNVKVYGWGVMLRGPLLAVCHSIRLNKDIEVEPGRTTDYYCQGE